MTNRTEAHLYVAIGQLERCVQFIERNPVMTRQGEYSAYEFTVADLLRRAIGTSLTGICDVLGGVTMMMDELERLLEDDVSTG